MSNISLVNSITNNLREPVQFVNTEHAGDNRTIQPSQTASIGAWVPWCDSGEQFPFHHLELTAPKWVKYIYQSGPNVLASEIGFGQKTDIIAPTGSTFSLTINHDYSITVQIR